MSTEPERVELTTPDLAAEKRAAFDELFPGVIADGVLDAARLGQLLDTPVTTPADGTERFGLMWAGKQEAVRSLLAPSRGALIPEFGKSEDFDDADQVFIEGDNLEVLKLLQKAYNDRVKLIYIDPPYNTGNDFIYPDDFSDTIGAYLEYTGQVDADGNRVSASADLAGRRHSAWLRMMYPRLVLARNLLAQDGVLLCSISDVELPHLVGVLREIFGEENHLATFVWNNDGNIEQQSRLKVNHEYIVAFARDTDLVARPTVIDPNIPETSKLFRAEIENSITKNGPANPPSTVLLPVGFPASEDAFDVAPRDDAFPHVLDPIKVRDRALASPARVRSGWSSRRLLDLFITNGFVPIEDAEGKASRFALTPSGAIYLYKQRSGNQGHVLTVLRNMGTTKASSSGLAKNWGVIFDYPKPERLIQHLVATFSNGNDLVLDFFAGSGTTAHAVSLQNDLDGGARRCISVNLPEPTKQGSEAQRAGFSTISEITLARISRASTSKGLRVFRLGASHFRKHSATAVTDLLSLSESTLVDQEGDRSHLVAEVLLSEGVPLDAPWTRTSGGIADVITAAEVSVVLNLSITDEVVSEALSLGSSVVVFLEDGFAGADAVKANAVTNGRNLGITLKTI